MILELKGHEFEVTHIPDPHHGAPWEENDGHGVVTDWLHEPPNETCRVLCEDRGRAIYYDVAASRVKVKEEGWGIEKSSSFTNRQKQELAVEADYEYLRAWAQDEWHYIGIEVQHVKQGLHNSVWGVESNGDYKAEVAKELAQELIDCIEADEAEVREKREQWNRDLKVVADALRDDERVSYLREEQILAVLHKLVEDSFESRTQT